MRDQKKMLVKIAYFHPGEMGIKPLNILPLRFELLTKSLQNKLLNYPRAHIINSQSLNTNMVQLTVEQRTFLVKNVFETGSLKVTRKRFVSPSSVRSRLKRFGKESFRKNRGSKRAKSWQMT